MFNMRPDFWVVIDVHVQVVFAIHGSESLGVNEIFTGNRLLVYPIFLWLGAWTISNFVGITRASFIQKSARYWQVVVRYMRISNVLRLNTDLNPS